MPAVPAVAVAVAVAAVAAAVVAVAVAEVLGISQISKSGYAEYPLFSFAIPSKLFNIMINCIHGNTQFY